MKFRSRVRRIIDIKEKQISRGRNRREFSQINCSSLSENIRLLNQYFWQCYTNQLVPVIFESGISKELKLVKINKLWWLSGLECQYQIQADIHLKPRFQFRLGTINVMITITKWSRSFSLSLIRCR